MSKLNFFQYQTAWFKFFEAASWLLIQPMLAILTNINKLLYVFA